MKTITLTTTFLLITVAAAEAKCVIPAGYSFYPDQNDTVTYYPLTDSKGCRFGFNVGGVSIFTGANILSPAKNGKFTQTGASVFIYVPKPGFKGQDMFSVKVCGTNHGRSGCSTINYQATVE